MEEEEKVDHLGQKTPCHTLTLLSCRTIHLLTVDLFNLTLTFVRALRGRVEACIRSLVSRLSCSLVAQRAQTVWRV
jgi:hypothetical protein